MKDVQIGDSVWTTKILLFVEATHPERTDDHIEVMLPRREHLIVYGVNTEEKTIDVMLPDGYVATLSDEDLECGGVINFAD